MATPGGPYSNREWKRFNKGKGKDKGKDGGYGKSSKGWAVSDDFLADIVGTTSVTSAAVRPPPPPERWGRRLPRFPPKARPSSRDATVDVKIEDSEVADEDVLCDADLTPLEITVSPAPPPLGSLERPAFVLAVKDWLRHNFSTAEFEFIIT